MFDIDNALIVRLLDLVGIGVFALSGALMAVRDGGPTNVRIHHGDALDVLERLPEASVERVFLLHPDPWPKARHAKRLQLMRLGQGDHGNHAPSGNRIEIDIQLSVPRPRRRIRLGLARAEGDPDPTMSVVE